ncbi:hypothetical protein GCM10022415_13390 [Knoellia locipacati]|uniref:Uncharacterized protein n=1 Tax=Knoellia locipacati TaxID=882824 RepID=A0A512SZD6_9MICO|nr:hypothetical protein [Knoellia locipacati]GEQ13289.1 hypothetical protein KLO01_13360 [Knoellia locipacati]
MAGKSRVAASSLADNADLPRLVTVLDRATWFTPLTKRVPPGQTSKDQVRIPVRDAQRLLVDVVRLVADLPKDTTPVLVWQQGAAELEVDTSATTLDCDHGLVTVGVRVDCDQLREPTAVSVPFAVGTVEAPTGLVMSTFTRLSGPPVVTDAWSDAITAFAWESLVELTRRVCAQLGRDTRARALIPGGIAAEKGVLLVQPMSRTAAMRG